MIGMHVVACALLGAQDFAIQDPQVRECSGIVAGRRREQVFYAHNDSGCPPELFVLDGSGRTLERHRVEALNRDWEDLAIDERGVYIADIGNNRGSHREVVVLRIEEPAVGATGPLPVSRRWKLRYPQQPFDSETLLVHGETGYVVEKTLRGAAGIYRFDLAGPEQQTLEQVAVVPDAGVAWTGGEIRAGRLLLVCAAGCRLWELGEGGVGALAAASGATIIDPESTREAGCLLVDGGVVAVGENRLGRVYLASDISAGFRRIPSLPHVVVPLAPRALVIDGSLTEWDDRAPAASASTPGSATGARFHLGWRPDALVVAGHVPDAEVRPLTRGLHFQGDCVEIFLDAGTGDAHDPGLGYGERSDRCALVFREPSREAGLIWPRATMAVEAGTVAVRIDVSGYDFEVLVPWPGGPVAGGASVRLAVSVLSATPRGNWFVGSSNEAGVWSTPWLWATAVLDPQ